MPNRSRKRATIGIALAVLLTCLIPATAARADAASSIRITEWMYSGSGGEFVELTNVGAEPVDMAGWSYDDDSASPGGFDLSGFGTVGPGESVVFTEDAPETFRDDWDICGEAKVIGPYTNNLGRGDRINVFDADGELVDRLTYGDEDFAGSIRTQDASGWVSVAGLGVDDVLEWTLSTVDDGEGSWTAASGDVGSPGVSTLGGTDPCGGEIRITEWMYSGSGGEFVELTNVGAEPVDMAGWSYDDDSASPGGFDLSGFGTVGPGESVVFTESDPGAFRDDWDICGEAKVIGPYTNNLGRGDQINVFDADGELVDRLTYGDEDFAGSIRTQDASGWVSVAGLGVDDVLEWTLSTVGDSEASWASVNGDIGSPGLSVHGGTDHCGAGGGENAPTIELDRALQAGSIGDPSNPGALLTLDDPDGDVEDLTIEVASGNPAVIDAAGIAVAGSGSERTISFAPVGRGVATVTFTVSDPEGNEDTANLSYAASSQAPDLSGAYHHHISDASAALDVGDGHMLLVNDETNTIFLHSQATTGLPVKTWTFTPSQLGTGDEIDFESIARSGDLLVLAGSHGNSRTGAVRTERRTFVAATITGSGADTELAFRGRYGGLWSELRAWDQGDGHGLGADALGFMAATAAGIEPNPPGGFNVEAMEFAPNGETLYLGFRAPTVEVEGTEHALIVPLLNPEDVSDGMPAPGPTELGAPILLDLDGRSIRALRSNEHGEYLISAGPSPSNDGWALYTWDGNPESAPAFNRELPDPHDQTGGVWESIVAVPHPLEEGAPVRLVTDSGDTNYYGTVQTKDLPEPFQKSYSQEFALGEVDGGADATAPVTSVLLNGAASQPSYGGDVVVTFTADDPGDDASGVDRTEYRIDSAATGWQTYDPLAPPVVASAGQHTVEYRSRDLAGNVEQTRTVAFAVVTGPVGEKPGGGQPGGQRPGGDSGSQAGRGDTGPVRMRLRAPSKVVSVGPRKRLAKLRFRVRNAGSGPSGRVVLCVRAPKGKLQVVGRRCVSRASMRPGQARQRSVRLRVRPAARGKVTRIALVVRGPGVTNETIVVRLRARR